MSIAIRPPRAARPPSWAPPGQRRTLPRLPRTLVIPWTRVSLRGCSPLIRVWGATRRSSAGGTPRPCRMRRWLSLCLNFRPSAVNASGGSTGTDWRLRRWGQRRCVACASGWTKSPMPSRQPPFLARKRTKLWKPSSSYSSSCADADRAGSGQRSRGNLCISPQLQDWISEEIKKESSIAKERHKTREEKSPIKPPKSDNAGRGRGDGRGGGDPG